MEAYIVVGASVAIVFVALVWRILQKNAAKRAARAQHAHSEPGGPHRHHHGGASGDAAARLAEGKRDWGGT